MLDAFLAVMSGGATGLLGVVFQGVMDHFKRKDEHKIRLAEMAKEERLMDKEIALARAEADSAAKIVSMETEKAAVEGSYAEARKRWSRPGDSAKMEWVDVGRGLTRPAITWGLCLAVVIMALLGISGPGVESVQYMATMAASWWFGGRLVEKGR